jgi:hypothetical protein
MQKPAQVILLEDQGEEWSYTSDWQGLQLTVKIHSPFPRQREGKDEDDAELEGPMVDVVV